MYPYIIYGIILWSAAYQAHLIKINVLHKKIIRSIFNANYNDHTNEFFVQLNIILKLGDIARHQSGIFMFKFINENRPTPLLTIFSSNYEVHSHYTRISSYVRPVRAR